MDRCFLSLRACSPCPTVPSPRTGPTVSDDSRAEQTRRAVPVSLAACRSAAHRRALATSKRFVVAYSAHVSSVFIVVLLVRGLTDDCCFVRFRRPCCALAVGCLRLQRNHRHSFPARHRRNSTRAVEFRSALPPHACSLPRVSGRSVLPTCCHCSAFHRHVGAASRTSSDCARC